MQWFNQQEPQLKKRQKFMGEVPEWARPLAGLMGMGALIAVAKLLVSSEQITFRVVVGRAILGAATSTMAGLVLIQVPNIPPLALIAIGSALGIVGSQYVEKALRAKVATVLEETKQVVEGKDHGNTED